MLRSLLIERFRLKIQEEQKEGRIFLLRIDKHGPRLSKAKDRRVFPFVGFGPKLVDNQPDFVEMQGENASMSKLANRLSQELGTPVRDETGLEGAFDFRFEYVRGMSQAAGPSLFTGIRTIGLRLILSRGPVATLTVVDAQQPSRN